MPTTENPANFAGKATSEGAVRTGLQQQQALATTDALQNAILNSSGVALIATDENGTIRFFNPGAERLLGYAAADLVGLLTPTHICDPLEVIARAVVLGRELATTIAPGFEALVCKAARGMEDVYELTCVRKDGSRFSAVMSVTALRDAQDGIIGYLLQGTDNSARKLAQEELRQAERKNWELELADAKSASDRISLAKSDFLLGMSHQVRTPLNAILGFAQLMASDSPAPSQAQKENIAQILQAGWYLMELNKEVLDLAMIESGRLSWSLEPMSLSDAMLECQTAIGPQAQRRGIRVTFPRFDTPLFVKADRTRVLQVLMNLLSNAVKYNRVGGSVEVRCNETGAQRIRVSVQDSGAGLPPEKLAQLFQPFNRLGQEASAEEGTGIGLLVSKRLVELMGGSIGVSSSVGAGSVFWIELVLAAAPQLEVDPAQRFVSAQPPPANVSAPRTLLYVEDNPANLQLVAQIVARRPDLHLLCAKTAVLGIDIALASRPDMILMDINLPGMGGFEAMHLLRGDARTAHIPVVALTANAIPRDIERGLEAGFFRYLTKPIRVTEFLETVDEALAFAGAGLRERSVP